MIPNLLKMVFGGAGFSPARSEAPCAGELRAMERIRKHKLRWKDTPASDAEPSRQARRARARLVAKLQRQRDHADALAARTEGTTTEAGDRCYQQATKRSEDRNKRLMELAS